MSNYNKRPKDLSKNKYLEVCGYKLLRLSEHEINDGSFIDKINTYVV